MYRSKREVDRYVTDLERTSKSDLERDLKGLTVAKLYYNIGDFQTALVYLDKYDSCRKNSPTSLKLRAQVFEGLATKAEVGEKSLFNARALEFYRRSVELDLSQSDLLLKIGELMLTLPIEEHGKATYWLEEASKVYPSNKNLKKLREKISCAKDGLEYVDIESQGAELNGNNDPNESDDNVAYWSASTGGGSSFLNTSLARLEMRETTSTPRASGSASLMANSQTPRFTARPSPDRIASQIRNIEVSNEKVINAVNESGKSQVETLEAVLAELKLSRDEMKLGREENSRLSRDMLDQQTAILNEVRTFKEDSNRQLRETTRAFKDATAEMSTLSDDLTRQFKALVAAVKSSRDETDEDRGASGRSSSSKAHHEPPDINELIMQQYTRLPPAHLLALMQMNQFAMPPHLVPQQPVPPVVPVPVPQVVPVQPPPPAPMGSTLQQIPLTQSPAQRPAASGFETTPQFTLTPITQAAAPAQINTPKSTAAPIKPSILGTPTISVSMSPSTVATSTAPTKPVVANTSVAATTDVKNSPFSMFAASPFAPNSSTTPAPKPSKPDPATASFFSSLNAANTPTTGFTFGAPTPTQNSAAGITPKKEATSTFSFMTPKTEAAPKDSSSTPVSSFSFKSATAEAAQRADEGDDHDDSADHDHDHDPHFEPIIPLPELVQVKTGEEEEETLFEHKAKMFRFDPETKEWKERGIGKLKILKHPVKGTFRVLLRREQVHKIAVNHSISKDIELRPMNTSATALCYYAMDYSEEELHLEHLAVKFKLEETKDEFKKVFESCQEELRKRPTPQKNEAPKEAEKEKPKGSEVKKDLSQLEAFKPKSGSWECPGCMIRNDADKIQCPACQTAQPGKEEEVKKKSSESTATSSFKFGSAVSGGGFNLAQPSSTTPATGGFKFGAAPASTPASTPATSGFVFGSTPVAAPTAPAPAASTAPSGFLFGKTEPAPSAPTSGFSFGSSAPKPAETEKPVSSFSFASFASSASSKPEPAATEAPKPSPFAGFSFGLKTNESSPAEATKGVDLSASKNLSSFADLAATASPAGFGFGAKGSTSFTFSGAGAPVFGQGSAKKDSTPKSADNHDDDDGHVEENEHDPHFEPIIPLPELVQVTTGEEEEEELFVHKGKCYRFDPDTKEWKERGIGNIKILKHKTKGTYRVLLRREQVHKVAVNHAISKDIEIKPMNTSTTAVCYYAMDFAEETLKLEHLAVRFKQEETLKEFKRVFEQCQADLKEKGGSPSKPAVDPCAGLKDKVEELTTLEKFKPKADSWECPGCMCRNEASKAKCPSCDTPKPGSSTVRATAVPPVAASTIFTISGAKVEELKSVETSDPNELSFENMGLRLNTGSEASKVAEKILEAKSMKVLRMNGNTIGIEAAEVIGQALSKHPEFERALWKDMFTGRMKTEIPPALKHLSNGIMLAKARLVEIDLSDNAFGPIGAEGIADLLKSEACYSLKELRLNNTGCGVTGGKLLAKTLLECYHNSGKTFALKVFVLGRSRQENEGAKALAEVFKLMGSLEEVVMPQNGIYHAGISALADAFANNPNLRILNMNDNTFTETGAAALAKALPKLQKLAVLNLGDCLLKTKGAQLIADALKSGHPDLEELYLDSNEIRYDGGKSIVDIVANKSKLKVLKLDGNQFGADGCGKLMKQLTDAGKRHVLDEIEDDEEPDDDEEEDGQENGEDEDEDDDDEEDDEEDDNNVMFDGACRLFSKDGQSDSNETSLGVVSLRIIYDDDVYGARIIAVDQEDEEHTVCNHLIAMQTTLNLADGFKKMQWSALDFSRDPPTYRYFSAEFEDEDLGREFRDIFTEGKELAEQSEILEQPDLEPGDMYYGEGGDYEEDS